MSLEILLVPLAIAATGGIAEIIKKRVERQSTFQYVLIQTRMKDEALLKKALQEWDTQFRQIEEGDQIQLDSDREAVFIVGEEGRYLLVLPETEEQEKYTKWIENLEKSYTHYLQQEVYTRLRERAEEQGMILEKEELMQDDSIQLTYVINQNKV